MNEAFIHEFGVTTNGVHQTRVYHSTGQTPQRATLSPKVEIMKKIVITSLIKLIMKQRFKQVI